MDIIISSILINNKPINASAVIAMVLGFILNFRMKNRPSAAGKLTHTALLYENSIAEANMKVIAMDARFDTFKVLDLNAPKIAKGKNMAITAPYEVWLGKKGVITDCDNCSSNPVCHRPTLVYPITNNSAII